MEQFFFFYSVTYLCLELASLTQFLLTTSKAPQSGASAFFSPSGQGSDLGHDNVIELLHSLSDLVLVGLDIHSEHKCIAAFYLLSWLTW